MEPVLSPRRFAARKGAADANQSAIVRALRQCGASVVDLHAVGGGVSDLLVGHRGVNYLLEVKVETGMLRESQTRFIAEWRGLGPKVVRTPAEALQAIGISSLNLTPNDTV